MDKNHWIEGLFPIIAGFCLSVGLFFLALIIPFVLWMICWAFYVSVILSNRFANYLNSLLNIN